MQDLVKQMPVFNPSEEEFQDPISYIESLISGAANIS
jgi:hypothetical protein